MKPMKVTGLELAFGGDMAKLLPPMSAIPKEFQSGHNGWNKVVRDWFFCGLTNVEWKPKDGIDKGDALNHIKAIMGSFEPSHEHKEAGCSYLLNEFFEDVKYDLAK